METILGMAICLLDCFLLGLFIGIVTKRRELKRL